MCNGSSGSVATTQFVPQVLRTAQVKPRKQLHQTYADFETLLEDAKYPSSSTPAFMSPVEACKREQCLFLFYLCSLSTTGWDPLLIPHNFSMKFYCLSLYILCIFCRHTSAFSLQTTEVSTYFIFHIAFLTYVVPVVFSRAYKYLNTLVFFLSKLLSHVLSCLHPFGFKSLTPSICNDPHPYAPHVSSEAHTVAHSMHKLLELS
jgi:hypothetical protein